MAHSVQGSLVTMSPGSSQAKNKVVRGTHEVELRAYTFICAATICRRMIILVAWKLFSKSNYTITIFAGVFRPSSGICNSIY